MREVQEKQLLAKGTYRLCSGRAPVHGGKSPGMRNRDPFVNLLVLRGLLLGSQVRLTDLRSAFHYFVTRCNAAPSTGPGPDSCTKTITRRLAGSVRGSSLTRTSWTKLFPFSKLPTFVRLCTTATWLSLCPPFSPRNTWDSARLSATTT